MRSFRGRLAGIGALTSGLVLVVFGSVVWNTLHRDRIRAVDEEMQAFGFLIAGRSGAKVNQQKMEESLLRHFGESNWTALKITDGQKYVLVDSSWPSELTSTSFPPGSRPLDPQPVLPKGKLNAEGRLPPSRIQNEPRFYSAKAADRSVRVGVFSNDQITLFLARDLGRVQAEVRRLGFAFLAALPGALLIIAVGSALLARKALHPIEVLSRRMESLSAEGLDQRLELSKVDREFDRIISAFNGMMGRLEKSFLQANRFSADASHELKTPLAVLQGSIERARAELAADETTQTHLADMQDEVARLTQILESLLLLSRADAGKLQLSTEPLNLSPWLEPLVEDLGLMAEAKHITVESQIEPGVAIDADPILLQQAVTNLLTNAVKYNSEKGRVFCSLNRSGGAVEFVVRNTGPDLPAEDAEKLFERFFQADPAHGEGSGLGLSIAREIVEAHGGTLRFDRGDDGLNSFSMRLKS